MGLDPKDFYDPVEGEPIRDILGHLQNANIKAAQRQTNDKLGEIAALLKQQQAEAARIAALLPCPYCGGKIDGQYELCRHCKNKLSYVEGIPCKPGQEQKLKTALRNHRIEEENKKEKLLHEKYMRQKLAFERKNGVDGVIYQCYCGKKLVSLASEIGSERSCPSCKRQLVIIGKEQYADYLENKRAYNFFMWIILIMLLLLLIPLMLAN